MSPDPGPELDTRYVPGSPGAAWSEAEISTTRARILQVSIEAAHMRCVVSNVSSTGHSPGLGRDEGLV